MKRILLVDDLKTVHDTFDVIFLDRADEIDITHVLYPLGALGILSDTTFDLIILDYKMPDISGIALLEIIREHHINTPVAFFSADLPDEAQQKAKKLGVTLFLEKPPQSTEAFKDAILKACGGEK